LSDKEFAMNNLQRTKASKPNTSSATKAGAGKAFLELIEKDRDLARAWADLLRCGDVTGSRSKKISTRVDPGILAAAKKRFGVESDADVINAALAIVGKPDRFNEWLMHHKGQLSDDFELAI
jgi:hypothetical protein